MNYSNHWLARAAVRLADVDPAPPLLPVGSSVVCFTPDGVLRTCVISDHWHGKLVVAWNHPDYGRSFAVYSPDEVIPGDD